MILNQADRLYYGLIEVQRIYVKGTVVWDNFKTYAGGTVVSLVSGSITVEAVIPDSVLLSALNTCSTTAEPYVAGCEHLYQNGSNIDAAALAQTEEPLAILATNQGELNTFAGIRSYGITYINGLIDVISETYAAPRAVGVVWSIAVQNLAIGVSGEALANTIDTILGNRMHTSLGNVDGSVKATLLEPRWARAVTTSTLSINAPALSKKFCTVTFMHDGEVLYTTRVLEGESCIDPVAAGLVETPTKETTVQYTYEYSGWSTTEDAEADAAALDTISDDVTLYAAFAGTIRQYTARFYDGDVLLSTELVNYGEEAPAPEVTKEGYSLGWWTPLSLVITGDTDFVATWIEGNVTVVMPRMTFTGFTPYYDAFIGNVLTVDGDATLHHSHEDRSYTLSEDTVYNVEWDGAVYTCQSSKYSIGGISYSKAIGSSNVYYKLEGGYLGTKTTSVEPTDEPFLITQHKGPMDFWAYPDDGDEHTVMIYQTT